MACEDIADLSDARARARLGVTLPDLACAWAGLLDHGQVPPSWLVADRLMAAGFAGLLVRSFAPGATEVDLNAVIWTWAPDPPHQVRVVDPGGWLPRDEASWN